MPVWWTEGEPKADALAKLGLIATTAGSVTSDEGTDLSPLAKRSIIIWPDNDAPGKEHAARVAEKLRALGCTVETVDVAALGLAPKGDVVNWLAAHPGARADDVDALPKLRRKDVEVGGWIEPLPLVSDQEATPYPLDALPGGIGAAVREVVGFVQCPEALAACSALTALSTVVQGLVNVRRAEKLEGPVSLYLMVIAESGERKSTVDEHFVRPILEWELQKAEDFKSPLAENKAEMRAWEAKREAVLHVIKSAHQKGESTQVAEDNLKELEKAKPRELRVPRLKYGDITPEKLGECLALAWPSGAVISAEAGIVLGSHALQSDSQMRSLALLNSLWSGESFQSDRRTQTSYALHEARLTMGLQAQPGVVRQFFEATKGLARGSGFAARFLIAWPTSTQGTRLFRDPPESWPRLSAFRRRISALVDMPFGFDEHGILKLTTLDLTPGARTAWIQFHDEVEQELRPGGDMAETRDVASKAADNAARLAALFHVYEHGPTGKIEVDAMQSACKLAAWHLYEARRFLNELVLPVHVVHAAKLDQWLRRYCAEKGKPSVLRSEVQRLGPSPMRDGPTLDKAIAALTEVYRVRMRGNGREKWLDINPRLLGDAHGAA
jgi:putative DNA primase/helicase